MNTAQSPKLSRDQIISTINRERLATVANHPTLQGPINSFVAHLIPKLKKPHLNHVSELFDLCPEVDQALKDKATPAAAAEIIQGTRSKVHQQLVLLYFEVAQKKLSPNNFEEAQKLSQQKQLAVLMIELVPLIRKFFQENPEIVEINQHRLAPIVNGKMEDIRKFIHNPSLNISDWEMFKDLLPIDLKDRFRPALRDFDDKKLRYLISTYKDLIKKIGGDAVIQFLISSGQASVEETSKLRRVISECLGNFTVKNYRVTDLCDIPANYLRFKEIQDMFFYLLRNSIYIDLLDGSSDNDTSTETYQQRLNKLSDKIASILGKKLDTEVKEHRELYDRLFQYFKAVLSFKVPAKFKNVLTDPTGTAHYFPSLRQRIAAYDLITAPPGKRKKLIAFFMGQGKTASALLGREMAQTQEDEPKVPLKTLWLCPSNLVQSQELSKETAKFYKTGKSPKIGYITPGLSKEDQQEILEDSDIIVIGFSMLKDQLVDQIIKQPFKMMVVDEVHNVRNESGRNTKAVRKILQQTPDLNEKGYSVFLSGDPTPNKTDDMLALLRLYDPKKFGDVKSLRAAFNNKHPFEIRNIMLDFMILLDPQEEWEKHITYHNYRLSPAEQRIYDSVFFDDSIDAGSKLARLNQAILCPSAHSLKKVPSTLFNQTAALAEQYLTETDIVVIGENILAESITRGHGAKNSHSFHHDLTKHFEGKAKVLIHDGQTKQDLDVLGKKKGEKIILLVQANTIREGINSLSHIKRAILLEPTYNKADTAQLVKRFAREGNKQVKVSIFYAQNTIHEGFKKHADAKYELTTMLKYGGLPTDEELAVLEDDFNTQFKMRAGRIIFGTDIVEFLYPEYRKLASLYGSFYYRGLDHYSKYVEQDGLNIANLLENNWTTSTLGNNAKFTAGLIRELEAQGQINGNRYLDLGSHNLLLDRTLRHHPGKPGQVTNLYSVDLNPHALNEGKKGILKKDLEVVEDSKLKVASYTNLKEHFGDESFDLVNCGLTLGFTKRIRFDGEKALKDERIAMLVEINRLLKKEGIAILTLPKSFFLENSPEQMAFLGFLKKHLGFEVISKYTGTYSAKEQNNCSDLHHVITVKKCGSPNLAGFKSLQLSKPNTIKVQDPTLIKKKGLNQDKGSSINTFTINDTLISYQDKTSESAEVLFNKRLTTAVELVKLAISRAEGNLQNIVFTEAEDQLIAELKIHITLDTKKSGGLKILFLGENHLEDLEVDISG